MDLEFWWLSVKISYSNLELYIVVFYRAPRYVSLASNFYDNFYSKLSEVSEYNGKVCICGDMNINWDINSAEKLKVKRICDHFGFKQISSEYPRRTGWIHKSIVKDNRNNFIKLLKYDKDQFSTELQKNLIINPNDLDCNHIAEMFSVNIQKTIKNLCGII